MQEKNQGQFKALACPWDEQQIIDANVIGYDDHPDRTRLLQATRGSQMPEILYIYIYIHTYIYIYIYINLFIY